MAISDPDVGIGERASHGVGVNVEVLSDPFQGPALFVQAADLIEAIGEDVLASLRSEALDVLHDGRTVNAEFVGKIVDRCASQVVLDEPINIGGDEEGECSSRAGSLPYGGALWVR